MSLAKCLRDLLQKDSFVYAISICPFTALPVRPAFQAINTSGLWGSRSIEELCSSSPLCYRIIYTKFGLPHHSRPLPITTVSSPTTKIHGNTLLKPDGYKNNRGGMMHYDLRRKGATGKWTGCWFINILKFDGHFNRKRTFHQIHPTHLTTSCLGLSDSSSRPPSRTTVWKQLTNTRKSLYVGKRQDPNPSLLANSPSNKHTLEKQAGKTQTVASINRTAAAQNTLVVCETGIRLKILGGLH